LLEVAVVLLGFGMNLREVVHAGRSGFLYTSISILFAMAVGLLLGRALAVGKRQSLLISVGTAICGGSAIAAMGPVIEAHDDDMAVSLGTIFLLNAVALVIFPPIGWSLHLSETQFGLWSALAIFDTSSVVGACARYGAVSLDVGTTVKLARALWIVPLAISAAVLWKNKQKSQHDRHEHESIGASTHAPKKHKPKIRWPWFILYFCMASVAVSYIPHWLPRSRSFFDALNHLGKTGLTVVLFLIGSGITRQTLRQVGVRPLLQAILLWVIVATVSLWAIHAGYIAL